MAVRPGSARSDHAVEGFSRTASILHDLMALEGHPPLLRVIAACESIARRPGCRTENQLAAWFSFTLPPRQRPD